MPCFLKVLHQLIAWLELRLAHSTPECRITLVLFVPLSFRRWLQFFDHFASNVIQRVWMDLVSRFLGFPKFPLFSLGQGFGFLILLRVSLRAIWRLRFATIVFVLRVRWTLTLFWLLYVCSFVCWSLFGLLVVSTIIIVIFALLLALLSFKFSYFLGSFLLLLLFFSQFFETFLFFAIVVLLVHLLHSFLLSFLSNVLFLLFLLLLFFSLVLRPVVFLLLNLLLSFIVICSRFLLRLLL